MASNAGGAIFRFIINLIIFLIVVSAIYILGLMFHFIPLAFTPQVMFKDTYASMKASMKTSDSGFKKNVYEFMDTMETSYTPKPVTAPKSSMPAEISPAAAAIMTTPPAPGAPESLAPAPFTTVPVTTTTNPVRPSDMPEPTGPAIPNTSVPVTTTTTPVPASNMPPVTTPPELPQVPVTPSTPVIVPVTPPEPTVPASTTPQ